MINQTRNTPRRLRMPHRALALLLLPLLATAAVAEPIVQERLPIEVRAKQVKEMRFGMFICWSLSTFSGTEWTDPVGRDPSYFKATGCDTDQWARTAKEAGMGYILFLAKHHDGFCLWDTKTTEFKVTRSPLGIDVLRSLRGSCEKYGIKLALYFSEGDWTFPGAKGIKVTHGSGQAPELVRAQLQELCTQYGPVEFFWLDCAGGHAGLKHAEINAWIKKFQPNCLVGANGGLQADGFELRAGEVSRPTPVTTFPVGEFTFPILPTSEGGKYRGDGAMWFYSLPKYDQLCLPAEDVLNAYRAAVKQDLILSLDVGPNHAGRLRDIDVSTLQQVGAWIRDPAKSPAPLAPALSSGRPATASSFFGHGTEAAAAFDDDLNFYSRWNAGRGSVPPHWLEVDLGREQVVGRFEIAERTFYRVQEFAIECFGPEGWRKVAGGTTIAGVKIIDVPPLSARRVRLVITKDNGLPAIEEFRVLPPAKNAP